LGRKSKHTIEEKLCAVIEYLEGNISMNTIAKQLGINKESFRQWVANYESMGAGAYLTEQNKHYSKEVKEQAVTAYLAGEGSFMVICKKYKIHSTGQLKTWVKKYNGHEELKGSRSGGTVIMTKGRKTKFEERVEIASHCISHDHNYAETAKEFKVSYQQARNYTVKYEKNGIDALQDNRGKRKSEDSLTELERLRAELKLEKAKREKAEMESSFLKKLDEVERRRG
jgi:transposase-like protein